MSRPSVFSFLAAMTVSAAIGLLDAGADEVQPAVFLILVGSAAFTAWRPAHWAWWIAIFGSGVVGVAIAGRMLRLPLAPPQPTIFAGFLALVPAAIGGASGAILRRGVPRR